MSREAECLVKDIPYLGTLEVRLGASSVKHLAFIGQCHVFIGRFYFPGSALASMLSS